MIKTADQIIDLFQEIQIVGRDLSDNIMVSGEIVVRVSDVTEKEFDTLVDILSDHWGDHDNYTFEIDGMYYEDSITARVIMD